METNVIIYSDKLNEVIIKSGIDLTEADTIKGSYLPFLEQFEEIKKQAAKIDIEKPNKIR